MDWRVLMRRCRTDPSRWWAISQRARWPVRPRGTMMERTCGAGSTGLSVNYAPAEIMSAARCSPIRAAATEWWRAASAGRRVTRTTAAAVEVRRDEAGRRQRVIGPPGCGAVVAWETKGWSDGLVVKPDGSWPTAHAARRALRRPRPRHPTPRRPAPGPVAAAENGRQCPREPHWIVEAEKVRGMCQLEGTKRNCSPSGAT